MNTFDPSKPALLRDQLNGDMIAWTVEQAAHWRQHANAHRGDVIEWEGCLMAGASR